MSLLKKDLASEKWGKQLWADYMWYEPGKARSLFLGLESEFRWYRRELCVFQDNINKDIMDAFINVTYEDLTDFGIRIFPHSNIEYLDNDKETVRSYVHREDFIVQIAFDIISPDITIEVNHTYMSYKQMLEIIEPLFEKRGIKIKDKTDPYIYANYPPDYIEYHEHPCGGYEFID